MQASGADDDEGRVTTPVAEYQLAGSPRARPLHDDETTTATFRLDGFALKSPFARRSPTAEREAKSDHDDVDELVDTFVESPSKRKRVEEKGDADDDNDNDDEEEQEKQKGDEDKQDKREEECKSDEYRSVHVLDDEANAPYGYVCNTVITSRFTIYNFIPKLLFYEFSKLANAYFLIISIMQTIKPISNTGGFPASLPALSIIVLIDMFFACLEDYKRHKADHTANQLPCRKEPVPADLVILGVCEPEPENPAGICYVETKSLDGETNLKLRQGLEATYTILRSDQCVANLEGAVVCEQPNNAIHRFNGTLTLQRPEKKKEVITANAVCLRGSTLRNTEYIYGLVVNTGPDTKIMMASSDAPMKWSDMETRLNKQITYICGLMIVLCLTGATASTIWNSQNLSKEPNEAAWYLYDPGAPAIKAPAGYFVIQLLYYFLLLNSFIPVSLYVSMTSVKFMQSYFMNNDKEMYHDETDTPCQVRTMSLNEELGQIDYIFSDKTGTLTCNIMEFRKCSIQAPFVNYQDDAIFDALSRQDAHAAQIRAFFEHLAVCHTVMPEKAPDGTVRLSASSPDEQALVAAAACFGYKFAARAPGKAILEYIKPGHVDSPTAVSAPIGSDPERPLILYIFYKNVMMNLTQFWYMIFTGFSGQKFFLEWGLQGYNLLFTALPIVLVSTFEQDVPARYAQNYPVLYRVGQENSHFNTKIVWAWISSCVWESIVISLGTIYGMKYLLDSAFRPSYKHLAQEVHAFGLERLADKLLSFPPPETIPREERRDLEAAEAVKDVKPVLRPAKKEQSWRFRGPRKSITRGSAFSYDAESVMVESFMASERYNRDPQTARPIFERHASRGSMAFHTFVGHTSHLHGAFVGIPPTASSPVEEPANRTERQNSAGNVFRGARHSFGGRRRFFSVTTMGPGSGSGGATAAPFLARFALGLRLRLRLSLRLRLRLLRLRLRLRLRPTLMLRRRTRDRDRGERLRLRLRLELRLL
ncbi:hypothetical protein ATCC90586_003536 [Pythium insidiosum]|nr:hypothetical protein ATCC90586_003536 [Pythium insidiosum]